jgi:hypothetical protein
MRFSNTIMIVGAAVAALFSAGVDAASVTIPNKTIFKALVAVLDVPVPVAAQWKAGMVYTVAWDFSLNCFSE